MKNLGIWKFGLAVVVTLAMALTGCGGGGGDATTPGAATVNDTDGDGIPNAADALPANAARFVDNVTVLLTGLNPGGAGFTTATAVNNGGAVVGFSENAANQLMAARWTVNATTGAASAPATLNPPAGGTYSAALGVNTAGLTVGASESGAGGNIVAAFWPAGAASGAAATVLPAGGFPGPSSAYGVNNLTTPQIVGEATTTAGNHHAVLWNGTTGAPVDLGILPGGTFSAAYAINDGGMVVGEADASGVTHAVAWLVTTAGARTLGPVDLGIITVADVRSAAYGIDSSGRVVGESENAAGEIHAGMWTLNPATLVPTAKKDLGANAAAYAINEADRIAGRLGTTDVATVWDTRNTALPNGAVPETSFSQAFGINSGNLVVGLSGTRAFVAVPK